MNNIVGDGNGILSDADVLNGQKAFYQAHGKYPTKMNVSPDAMSDIRTSDMWSGLTQIVENADRPKLVSEYIATYQSEDFVGMYVDMFVYIDESLAKNRAILYDSEEEKIGVDG